MPGSPVPQLTVLLLLPALAASGSRWARWNRPVSLVALVCSALALALLPVDSTVAGVGVSAFGRGTAWLSLAGVAIVVFALPGTADRGGTRVAWLVHLMAFGLLVSSRSPLLLVLVVLVVAASVPRLDPVAGADGWRRSLAVGGLLAFTGLLAVSAGPSPLSDLTLAGGLVLGFLLVTGAAPFGIGTWRWLSQAGPRRAAAVSACLVPALCATLVDNLDPITRLQLAQPTRATLTIAIFGAATLVAAALHSLTVRGWHGLGADGVLFDLGLALVGVGAGGLDGAALVLTVLVLTRPLMFLVESLQLRGAWGRVGAAAALLGSAGMPPTLGFAARLLVLASAFRVSLPLALVVLSGVLLQLLGSARLVLARLADAVPTGAVHSPTRSERVAIGVVVAATVVAGILPGMLLSRVWAIG